MQPPAGNTFVFVVDDGGEDDDQYQHVFEERRSEQTTVYFVPCFGNAAEGPNEAVADLDTQVDIGPHNFWEFGLVEKASHFEKIFPENAIVKKKRLAADVRKLTECLTELECAVAEVQNTVAYLTAKFVDAKMWADNEAYNKDGLQACSQQSQRR